MMYLQSLTLRNFRNYEKAHVVFGPSINLIQGENAQGKTNLLEAIYLLSTGRSFRTASLSDLIRYGQDYFYLEAQFFKDGIEQTLKLLFDGKQRKMQYNTTSYASFTNLLGLLPTVLFAPEDVSLIIGAPAERRRFIDMHIAQLDPLYVHHLMRYYKAMKQRNCLLKQKSETAIGPWEESMAVSAAYLLNKRLHAVQEIAAPLNQNMQELSMCEDTLAIQYQCSFNLEQMGQDPAAYLLAQYQKSRPKEMYLGSTLYGPHRDDLIITVREKEANAFASEGQKRSAIAALRLSEWQRLKNLSNAAPIMSIDDFGIHLDDKRYGFLQKQLKMLGQVFLTSPSSLTHLSEDERSIHFVEKGQILNQMPHVSIS